LEYAGDAGDFITARITKLHSGNFDDLVPGVEAGRLEIDDDAEPAVVAGWRRRRHTRDEAATRAYSYLLSDEGVIGVMAVITLMLGCVVMLTCMFAYPEVTEAFGFAG